LDHVPPDDEAWGTVTGNDDDDPVTTSPFDEYGQYQHHVIVQYAGYFAGHDNDNDIDGVTDQCVFHAQSSWENQLMCYAAKESSDDIDIPYSTPDKLVILPKTISKCNPDYDALVLYLVGWPPQFFKRHLRIPCNMCILLAVPC
jgi:hypothetical protein